MNTPINFETAKLLKEKGFDNVTENLWHYNGSDCIKLINKNQDNFGFSAPTITEVVMWLYEKHRIWIYTSQNSKGLFQWYFDYNAMGDRGMLEFNSPTEAYEAAIEYVLNNLI